MIDQNFPDIYEFWHGISTDKKKTLSVIYPELEKFSGDTTARTFLRFSVENF